MQDLSVSFIQESLNWHDPVGNRALFEQRIATLPDTDLIILPEMFTTGFSMKTAALAEPMEGESMTWMAKMAMDKNAVVSGSLIIKDGPGYFNRLIWMRPDGSYLYYDKRHLFRMADEHHHFSEGRQRLVTELKGWRICPMICYDLRFPVWSRNNEGFHLLYYVANWPKQRREHWKALLTARAIENQCYVIGVNRTGTDGRSIEYSGDSCVVDALGTTLVDSGNTTDSFNVTLDANSLRQYLERFPAYLDADHFSIDGED